MFGAAFRDTRDVFFRDPSLTGLGRNFFTALLFTFSSSFLYPLLWPVKNLNCPVNKCKRKQQSSDSKRIHKKTKAFHVSKIRSFTGFDCLVKKTMTATRGQFVGPSDHIIKLYRELNQSVKDLILERSSRAKAEIFQCRNCCSLTVFSTLRAMLSLFWD